MVNVLFVCLGNICRSPTAHGIFAKKIQQAQLQKHIMVDSCGTGDWHIGLPPDKRSQQAALARGYDLSHLTARQLSPSDFETFDYILGMDNANMGDIKAMQPAGYQGHVGLFLNFASKAKVSEVPDPYYGGEAGFSKVIDLVEDAAEGLLQHIKTTDLK